MSGFWLATMAIINAYKPIFATIRDWIMKSLPATNRAIKNQNRALHIMRYNLIKTHGVHGFLHGLKNNTRNKKKVKLCPAALFSLILWDR